MKKFLFVMLAAALTFGVLTGCGKESGSFVKSESSKLDTKRIAADEARGIKFSEDKRTLVKFNKDLEVAEYAIPEGVTTIGDDAFAGCLGLKGVTIPSSVTTIGDEAFAVCDNLKSVTIPSGVTTIGEGAFLGGRSVKAASGHPVFYNDDAGALIDRKRKTLLHLPRDYSGAYTIPPGVTTIGEGAFAGCRRLEYVGIPEGVTTIGDKAFTWCTSLTSVTIPEGVTTIGKEAFSECGSVKAAPGHPVFYNDAAGALIDRKRKMLLHLPAGFTGTYTIPSSVTTIGEGAFDMCRSLTSVTIPSSVKSIEKDAFSWCENLTSVKIPSNVTTIGEGAFHMCRSLTSVTIPSSVTTIGGGAFLRCIQLTSVTIPSGVTTIGEDAFSGCWNLKSVTIPNSVTTIGKGAFANCPCEYSVKKQFPNYKSY